MLHVVEDGKHEIPYEFVRSHSSDADDDDEDDDDDVDGDVLGNDAGAAADDGILKYHS